MSVLPVLILTLQAVVPQGISEDSAEALRERARRAEREYEFLLRYLVPSRFGSAISRSECDEIVGRFCLTYDAGEPPRPEPEEDGRVVRARQDAVESLRLAFAALPGELTTAGPLLRYLVEDERADEAVSAALAFTWASRDSIWGPLLEGYALHAAGDDSTAALRFEQALARLSPEERRRYRSVEVLVGPEEERSYRELAEAGRVAYEEALWRLADPLYLVPGNERWAEHLARHVWSRLLSEAPRVRRMNRWGDDLEELTVRYGVPTSRERVQYYSVTLGEGMVEHYDPDQLTFIPQALATAGFPPTPAPGEAWPLDAERGRAGFATKAVRRLLPIAHQVSRFPAGDSTILRVDGALPLDSLEDAPVPRLRTGIFLLDADYRPVREARGNARIERDTALLSFELTIPAGTYVYGLELLDEERRIAGRARYTTEIATAPSGGPALSDLLVARPFGEHALPTGRHGGRLRPRGDLVLAGTDTVGLYAEAHRLSAGPDSATRYRVALTARSAEDPPPVARALRWLGRTLGLVDADVPPTVSWEGEGVAGRPAILAVDLPLAEFDPGLYVLDLAVTDLMGGGTATVTRRLRIRER